MDHVNAMQIKISLKMNHLKLVYAIMQIIMFYLITPAYVILKIILSKMKINAFAIPLKKEYLKMIFVFAIVLNIIQKKIKFVNVTQVYSDLTIILRNNVIV